MGQEVFV